MEQLTSWFELYGDTGSNVNDKRVANFLLSGQNLKDLNQARTSKTTTSRKQTPTKNRSAIPAIACVLTILTSHDIKSSLLIGLFELLLLNYYYLPPITVARILILNHQKLPFQYSNTPLFSFSKINNHWFSDLRLLYIQF